MNDKMCATERPIWEEFASAAESISSQKAKVLVPLGTKLFNLHTTLLRFTPLMMTN